MTIKNFLKDRTGATAVEYALIVALLAAVIVTAVTTLGGSIKTSFSTVAATLDSQNADISK